MRFATRPVVIAATAFLSIGVVGGWTPSAQASRPVPRTIVGCVASAAFVSEDGYTIRVRSAATRQAIDLRRFEGLRVSFTGNLLPGDVFFVSRQPRILGQCR